jgi:hypothetical protein
MLRLVETYFASARKPNLCDRTPSGLLHRRTLDALLFQRSHLGLKIVAHEIQLVTVFRFSEMNRRLRRRQRENQPPVAGINGCKTQNIPQKRPIRSSVLAVHNYMRTCDHHLLESHQLRQRIDENRS